jgi:hypothetical protein
MEGWNKLQSSLANLNIGQSANRFTKGFNSSVQATRERLGQVAPDEITELPQGTDLHYPSLCLSYFLTFFWLLEYKDLEAQVEALRTAHQAMLKFVLRSHFTSWLFYPSHLNKLSTESRKRLKAKPTTTRLKFKSP